MFATRPYRKISDDRRKPLARYGAMGARSASGLLLCYTTTWDTTAGGQNKSLRCHYFGRGAMLLAARISWRNRVKPLADLTPIPENWRFIPADRR